MNVAPDIASALAAIDAFVAARTATLPAALVTMLERAQTQPAPMRIVWVAEQLYANMATITDAPTLADAQAMCANCAMFGARYSWGNMDTRGAGIAAVVQRAAGVVGLATDPVALPEWAPTPATTPEPTSVAATAS